MTGKQGAALVAVGWLFVMGVAGCGTVSQPGTADDPAAARTGTGESGSGKDVSVERANEGPTQPAPIVPPTGGARPTGETTAIGGTAPAETGTPDARPAPAKRVLVVSNVAREFWVKQGGRWRTKQSRTLSTKMTVNGKPVPA